MRIAFIAPDLAPPAAAGETPSWAQLAWELAAAVRGKGAEVALLVPTFLPAERRASLERAAAEQNTTLLGLDAIEPPDSLPVFPEVLSHRLGWHVLARLRELAPDAVWFLGAPALAAATVGALRTGCGPGRCRIGIVAQSTLERERTAAGRFPAEGRAAIAEEFLERQAIAGADVVVCFDAACADWLEAAAWRPAGAPPVRLPPAAVRSPSSASGDSNSPYAAAPSATFADQEIYPLREIEALLLASLGQAPRDRAGHAMPSFSEPTGASQPLPSVSVCVPFYEQPRFLSEALACLAEQTLAPLEVIVVDDGSPGEAARNAFADAEHAYASRGWKFVRQSNGGPSSARNRAARLASGEVLLFCDADNRPRPDMVASFASAIAVSGADCVTCAFQAFRSEEKIVAPDAAADRGYVFAPLGPCAELALVENVLGDTNSAVRRSVFLELGGFPEANREASEDWQLWMEVLRRGRRLVTIPSVLFDYRLSQGSHARRHTEWSSACAALDPVLAPLDPEWRRLWAHAAGLVRDPRAPRLERALASEKQARATAEDALASLQAHADKLASDLDHFRTAARQRYWEIQLRQSQQQELQERHAAAERRIAEQADAQRSLEERLRDLDLQLRQQREKVRRMQQSASWQVTAPLRAARRATLDRLRSGAAGEGERVAAPLPRVRSALDQPSCWDAAPAIGAFTGWAALDDGTPCSAFRLSVDGRTLPVRTGIRRYDVAVAHGWKGSPAEHTGFSADYQLEADRDYKLVLEAQVPDGRWVHLHGRDLRTSSRPRQVHDYTAWVEAFGRVTPEKAASLRARLDALPEESRPLISVVMPVYNAPAVWLQRAIDSVRAQLYENWELCIADDASPAPHVRPLLERAAAADPRVRVVFRSQNGHISRASNSAIEIVRGDFIALLDHDDELPPDALAEVILQLAAAPDADVIFSDEDKIDEEGRRYCPYFKPDYLPDLLTSQNCFSHLSVLRTRLVRDVGGFRAGYEGSQDWDLVLRVVERTSPARIRHIPKVLYHWRAIEGSTAREVSEKSYSLDAARQALLDHFERSGLSVGIEPVPGSHWRIVHPLPTPAPLVSVVIPTRNGARLVRTVVGSLLARTDYAPLEILLVDNGSDDPEALALFEQLAREPDIRVLRHDAPFNYSELNNLAVREARGDFVCLLNNDIEVVDAGWLRELVSQAARPGIGAVGAMLYYPNRTVQHAGVVLGLGGVANHAFVNHAQGTEGYRNRGRLVQNYSAVTAACLVIRRATYLEVGGFDEKELAVAFNDIDFCLRVRAAGYLNLWTPFAELVHHESASRGKEDTPEKQARFDREVAVMRRRWADQLDHDPAYNVNLALSVEGWDLAWPPRS